MGDFKGLRVIWPPNGLKPPNHTHDIVFVHNQRSISDWKTTNGAIIPVQIGSELETSRIFGFGYDLEDARITSDGFFENDIIFGPGYDLCSKLNVVKHTDKHIPITFVGHCLGGVVVKHALWISKQRPQLGAILKQTSHVILVDTPHSNLTWSLWKTLSAEPQSSASRGCWQLWSTAVDSAQEKFQKLACYFNISSAFLASRGPEAHLDGDTLANSPNGRVFEFSVSENHRGQGPIDEDFMSEWLLNCIRGNKFCLTKKSAHILKIKSWLEFQPDIINAHTYERNLRLRYSGTGNWLLNHASFRQWTSDGVQNPILWLTGPEGSGKSVLSTMITHHVSQTLQDPAPYINFCSQKPRSAFQLASLLALQLVDFAIEKYGGVSIEILHVIEEESSRLQRIHRLLKILVSQCQRVFFILDGIDHMGLPEGMELPSRVHEVDRTTQHMETTLKFLMDLARNTNFGSVRVWCSSQNTRGIEKLLMENPAATRLRMEDNPVAEDIRRYLNHPTKQEHGELISKGENSENTSLPIPEIQRNFLLASLVSEPLDSRRSVPGETEWNFNSSPIDLNVIFKKNLGVIYHSYGSQKKDSSFSWLELLSLVTFAKRPLRLTEIEDGFGCLNSGNNLVVEEIVQHCKPFLTFVPIPGTSRDGFLMISNNSVLRFLLAVSTSYKLEEETERISPLVIAKMCLHCLKNPRLKLKDGNSEISSAFLPYATKYWAQHVDGVWPLLSAETKSFVQSPRFLEVIQIQSRLLEGYLTRNLDKPEDVQSMPLLNYLPSDPGMKILEENYRSFLREWSHVLRSEPLREALLGSMSNCFWGALGPSNFLTQLGTQIETNRSFLLEESPVESSKTNCDGLARYFQTISGDGSRIAVWKLRVLSEKDTKSDLVEFTRESWMTDGRRDPFQYGAQECLTSTRRRVRWDNYDSTRSHENLLVPILDYSTRLPIFEGSKYGQSVRVGAQVFRRDRKGQWIADTSDEDGFVPYWEDITTVGPYTVWSRRKRVDLEMLGGLGSLQSILKLSSGRIGQKEDSSQPSTGPESSDTESTASKASSDAIGDDSDEDISENEIFDVRRYEELENISSAEELYDVSGSEIDEGNLKWQKHRSFARGAVPRHDLIRDSHTQEILHPIPPMADRNNRSRASSEDDSSVGADADDEDSDSENEHVEAGDSDSESNHSSSSNSSSGSKHFLGCDVCDNHIATADKEDSELELCYQCNRCVSDDSYDICWSCYNKGAWCANPSHKLRILASSRGRGFSPREEIVRDEADPVLDIVIEKINQGSHAGSLSVFRYSRRNKDMLHNSKPIIHPSHPLVVYPLDGQRYLFGNLENNTYIIHKVPFDTSETNQTSADTCIPVSVHMSFSSCGRYVHVLRITARRESIWFGATRLHVRSITLRLSLTRPASGKPRTEPFASGADLGDWPNLMRQFPFAITWTNTHAYLSLSGTFLRVLRFDLQCSSKSREQTAYTLAATIALPQSATSRPVHYFPSSGNGAAKVILGSSQEHENQPPMVVYLAHQIGNVWEKVENQTLPPIPALGAKESLFVEPIGIEDEYHAHPRKLGPDEQMERHFIGSKDVDRARKAAVRNGSYCPSCFDLGMGMLTLYRPHGFDLPIIDLNPDPDNVQTGRAPLAWKVPHETLLTALESGCQFCCFLMYRLLGSSSRVYGPFLGSTDLACCSEGTVKPDNTLRQTISRLRNMRWLVDPEEQVLKFLCRPLDQDPTCRTFTKMSVTMPGVCTNREVPLPGSDIKFAPTMVAIEGYNEELDAVTTITTFIHTDESDKGVPECTLELFSLPDDAAHEWVPTRPISTSPGSDQNLQVIKGWLEECDQNHPFCQQTSRKPVSIPTRLLEIVDEDTVCLVNAAENITRYIALSYCWGPASQNNCPTTQDNVSSRSYGREGILRDSLPAAIRDAVYIVEKLGIKHIWVDALCIVQDSQEDKSRELARMGQYYGGAFLTIVANTYHCNQGFIGEIGRCKTHTDSPVPRDLVPFNGIFWSDHDTMGRFGTILLRDENPYLLSKEPISKRGWTFQERLLSNRVLSFGSRVMWSCLGQTATDGGIQDWSFDEHDPDGTIREFQNELAKLEKQSNPESGSYKAENDGRAGKYSLWHKIVGNYSKRAITYSEDKFPAIAAVAEQFSRMSGDEYIAGLWRRNIESDLLWSTPSPGTKRPEKWRAPSWSWASVDDPILYTNLPGEDASLLAEITQIHVSQKSPIVPFGEISSATLEIKAPCIESNAGDIVKMIEPCFPTMGIENERNMVLNFLSGTGKYGGELKVDLPNEVALLLLYVEDRSSSPDPIATAEEDSHVSEKDLKIWGLVLKPVDHTGDCYERILAVSGLMIRVVGADTLLSRNKLVSIM